MEPLEVARASGLAGALCDDLRLVFADHRGHGRSDKPHDIASYALTTRCADIVAVLDEVAIDRVHFVGVSWGARLGFALGEHEPSRLLSLALCGNQPYAWNLDSLLLQAVFSACAAGRVGDMSAMVETFESALDYRHPEPMRTWVLENDPLALDAALQSVLQEGEISRDLSAWKVPCLIYAGADDEMHADHAGPGQPPARARGRQAGSRVGGSLRLRRRRPPAARELVPRRRPRRARATYRRPRVELDRGLWSVAFALEHPNRVGRLVLAGHPPGVTRHAPLPLRVLGLPIVGKPIGRAVLGKPTREGNRKFWGEALVAHPERLADELLDVDVEHMRRNRDSTLSLVRRVVGPRGVRRELMLGERWQGLSVPTLFLYGDRDSFVSSKVADAWQAIAAKNASVRIVRIPGAGHLPWLDEPDAVLDEIERCLA